jgi:hypothetical protein
MLKAVWIAARSQPCACRISGTNCVQEYWMFEAATIQTMPKVNWGQRDASAGTAPADVFAVDAIVVCPLITVHFAVPTAIRSAYDSRPDSSREVSAHVERWRQTCVYQNEAWMN